ncbi:hypothetical protein [[Phormidium ambiguum] IAM M-71]|uniref:hypothetical protein n=1 Tax=[Phormidium ambiguum] IAM M-71 TaxID=454136 RepID=UPI0015B97106|nr:hypothetical protein [Phormidium ambiguum]
MGYFCCVVLVIVAKETTDIGTKECDRFFFGSFYLPESSFSRSLSVPKITKLKTV